MCLFLKFIFIISCTPFSRLHHNKTGRDLKFFPNYDKWKSQYVRPHLVDLHILDLAVFPSRCIRYERVKDVLKQLKLLINKSFNRN